MPSYKDNVRVSISNTPGTAGALTVNAPIDATYAGFAAGDNGLTFVVTAVDSVAGGTETFEAVYTHSGTSLSRGTRLSSTSGARINLTSAAVVTVALSEKALNRYEQLPPTFISGLIVTKGTGNTLNISAGKCYDPSSDSIVTYAGGTGISAGTLGASQWNQVYIYDNAGTAAIQVVNNADPPSTTYAGTARQGGTGSNRRWIGAFRTNGSSNIVTKTLFETSNGYKAYFPLTRVLSSTPTSPTTYTSVSLGATAPSYVTTDVLATPITETNAASGSAMSISLDGAVESMYLGFPASSATSAFWYTTLWMPVGYLSGAPRIYYLVNVAANDAYLDISGYEVTR